MNLRSGFQVLARRSGDAQMSVDFIDHHGSDVITIFVMSVTAARRAARIMSPAQGRG
jgi:hypothetical protein